MQIVVGYFKISNDELERRYLCMDEAPAGRWRTNIGSIFLSSRSAERNFIYWRENHEEDTKFLIEAQIRSVGEIGGVFNLNTMLYSDIEKEKEN